MSELFIVSTPIGHLEDITLRALSVFKNADIIICEDTRVTRKLLDRYEINKPLLSYHSHSRVDKLDMILQNLKQGKNCALVSDAGTPAISDPGALVVRYIRDNAKDDLEAGNIKITVIPGASALTASIALSGIPETAFTFLGFLPHKKGREKLFKEISEADRTMIFYESPHRLMKTLSSLAKYLDKNARVTICRELTKIYESVVGGKIEDVKDYFEKNPDAVRGEIVILVNKEKPA